MFQVYFLLVSTNLVGGIALSSGFLQEKAPSLADLAKAFSDPGFRLGLGLLTFVTGFFGILSVLPGDIPVLGDILPSLSALMVGTGLVLEYYHMKSPSHAGLVEKLDDVILKNKNPIGIAGMSAGLIHLVFPTVLLV